MLLTRRFRRIVAGVLVLGLLAFGSFFFYFSSRPEFCNSCHVMESYVAGWKSSTHKDTFCNECHFPPGWRNALRAKVAATTHLIKTITRTAGPKPHAEIEDAACLRGGCHETRVLTGQGKVLFKGKYNFDHASHLDPEKLRRGKKLRCTSCHSQIVQGEHITVTESVCFTCHFKGQKHEQVLDPIAGCTSCHGPPADEVTTAKGFAFKHQPYLDRKVACWKCHFDSVQGTGEVPRQVCLTCHGEKEKLEKFADATFMHDWHVTKRKVECFRCHGEIRHGLRPQPVDKEGKCAVCHGKGHGSHGDMFAGQGGRGIKDDPGKHSLANVDCVACHEVAAFTHGKAVVDAPSRIADEQACLECHGKKMKGTLADWKSTVADSLAEAKAEVAKAEKAYAALAAADPRRAKAKPLLDAARHNCEFVEKASGVHNLDYALDLLDKASDDAAEALRQAKAAVTKPVETTTKPAEEP